MEKNSIAGGVSKTLMAVLLLYPGDFLVKYYQLEKEYSYMNELYLKMNKNYEFKKLLKRQRYEQIKWNTIPK